MNLHKRWKLHVFRKRMTGLIINNVSGTVVPDKKTINKMSDEEFFGLIGKVLKAHIEHISK